MLADPQKQKLVYDLFLETVREKLLMQKGRYVDRIPDAKTIEMFQEEYDHCKNLVESLKL